MLPLTSVFSIHALLAESDGWTLQNHQDTSPFSIHALLAESDTWQRGSRITYVFSIHALLAESDLELLTKRLGNTLFLSTLSLRRATFHPEAGKSQSSIFYPRSHCGERPRFMQTALERIKVFYPRSPCGERPRFMQTALERIKVFYPRSPCGERPVLIRDGFLIDDFSIHALLAESDIWSHTAPYLDNIFYPRSPCGERRKTTHMGNVTELDFLSTLSLRRATKRPTVEFSSYEFSIHALLAESDNSSSGISPR